MTKVSLPALLVSAFLLSGCVHYVWVKPAGDQATFPADNYACKQEAMAGAPPVYQTYGGGPMDGAPEIVKTDCVNDGPFQRCKTRVVRHGYPNPPQTVDLNRSNRGDLFEACMGARGWVLQPVEDQPD